MKITFCPKPETPKACRVDELKRGVFGKQVGSPGTYFLYNSAAAVVTVFILGTKEHMIFRESVCLYGSTQVIPQPEGSTIKIEGV